MNHRFDLVPGLSVFLPVSTFSEEIRKAVGCYRRCLTSTHFFSPLLVNWSETANRKILHHGGKNIQFQFPVIYQTECAVLIQSVHLQLYLFYLFLFFVHLDAEPLTDPSTALAALPGETTLCFCKTSTADDTHRICSPSLVPRSGACLMS